MQYKESTSDSLESSNGTWEVRVSNPGKGENFFIEKK